MAGDVDTYQSKTLYESIFRALDNVGNRVRFIGMDVDPTTVDAPVTEHHPNDRISPEKRKSKPWLPDEWRIERSLPEGGQGWTYLVRRSDSSDPIFYVLKRLKNP